MANVNGVNYSKSIGTTSGAATDIVDAGVLGGGVRCHLDSYEASALASGSYILMGKQLQAGARILDIVLAWDALGSSTDLSVGDQGSTERYISNVTTTSAGITSLVEYAKIDGMHYEVTGTTDNIIRILMGGAAGTNTIKIAIYYTED